MGYIEHAIPIAQAAYGMYKHHRGRSASRPHTPHSRSRTPGGDVRMRSSSSRGRLRATSAPAHGKPDHKRHKSSGASGHRVHTGHLKPAHSNLGSTSRAGSKSMKMSRMVKAPSASFDDWHNYVVKAGTNTLAYNDIPICPGKTISLSGSTQAGVSMISDFRTGELNSPGVTFQPGIFDPPPTVGSLYNVTTGGIIPTVSLTGGAGVPVGVETMVQISDEETLNYEVLEEEFYYVNTTDVPIMIRFEELLCKESSDDSLATRCTNLYANQQYFEPQAAPPSDVQNEISFTVAKVPGIKNFWMLESFHEEFVLPGAEMKRVYKYSFKWDQAAYKKQNAGKTDDFNYIKNISRTIRISTRGGLGISPTDGHGNFTVAEIAIARHRFIKGFRSCMSGTQKKQYNVTQAVVAHLTTGIVNVQAVADLQMAGGGATVNFAAGTVT